MFHSGELKMCQCWKLIPSKWSIYPQNPSSWFLTLPCAQFYQTPFQNPTSGWPAPFLTCDRDIGTQKTIQGNLGWFFFFDEAILIQMHWLGYVGLEPVGKEFSEYFNRGVKQRNWSKLIYSYWAINLWDQSNVWTIDTLKADLTTREGRAEVVKVLLNHRPSLFEKFIIESIRPWRLISWQILMILSIFGLLNGISKELRSTPLSNKESRLKSIFSKLDVPNLSLKSLQMRSALCAWS